MLTKQQIECIDYLLIGTMTQPEMANALGCSDRAIRNWKQKAEFREEWHRRSIAYNSGLVEEAQSLLASKLGQAISNIVKIANSEKVNDKVRLEANMYLVNRILGNTSTKVNTEMSIEKTEESFDIDDMAEAI